MEHGVGKARAGQRDGVEALKAVGDKLQPRMLAGDIDARSLAKCGQRTDDGAKLYGFRARSDDKRDTRLAQFSPWLRRAFVP